MKKLLFVLASVLTMMFSVTCFADYNFVRVSDYGASAFVERMVQSNMYKQMVANGALVAFVSPVHRPNQHDQGFEGLSVYASAFGIKDSPNPEGEIVFYVDQQGYVMAMRAVGTGNPQITAPVLIMLLEALGVNEQERNTLLRTQSPTADVWCTGTNRRLIRVVTDNVGNNIVFFAASN